MEYLIRVKANHDCWISDIEGDPGRTTIKKNAMVFHSETLATHIKELHEVDYPNRSFSVEKANH